MLDSIYSMSDIENRTKVITPKLYKGRILVTRRERKLILRGKLSYVTVLGTDGLEREFKLKDLTRDITEENLDTTDSLK